MEIGMLLRKLIVLGFLVLFLSLLGCAEIDSNTENNSKGVNPPSASLVANAGPDAFIVIGSSYSLSASLSSSSRGIVQYDWSLSEIVSGDVGASVFIQNADKETTGVLFGEMGATTVFKFRLIVTDSSGATATDFVDVTVSNTQSSDLTVSAGSNISALSSSVVSLNGTVLDNGAVIAKTRWLQVSGDKLVTLTNSDTLTPEFTAPWLEPTSNILVFRLIVTDENGTTATDEVAVSVSNIAPYADPGKSRVVLSGTQVSLDGSGSKGVDGGVPSSYAWTSIGSNTVTLNSANTAIASFTAPNITETTNYEFQLTVTDNGKTDTQSIIISVVSELTYNDFGGRYYGVDIDTVNNVAYMAKGEGGLGIYDVSVPTSIEPLAIFNTEGSAQDIVVSNGYAYIADQFNDLVVVNIANPATPALAAKLPIDAFGNRATALAKHGDYLYVAGFYAGLITIDVANPESPAVLSAVDTDGKAVGVDVSGDGLVAYVADSSKGVVVYDLLNPANPVLSFTVLTSSDAYDVVLNGNYLYVADGKHGLRVYDVSNKNVAPALVTTINTDGIARKVILNDSTLLLADGNKGIKVFDISNPGNPDLISSYDTSGDAEDVATLGNHVVVADSYAGMAIIDFSNFNLPVVASSYTTIGAGKGVAVKGNYAYVADFHNGLIVLDISNPFSPELASHLSYDDKSRGIVVEGNYAYIGNSSTGLRIIDITDPLNPQSLSTASLALNLAQNVAIGSDGSLAYVSGFYGGLFVVDITDKANPVTLGSTDFGSSQSKFVTQLNDIAYVANGDQGFAISDIVDPSAPSNTAVLPLSAFSAVKPGDGHMVAVQGDYAYLAHNAAGLSVINVSNSVAPVIIGEHTGNLNSINSVFIHGSTLFATNSNVDSPLKEANDSLVVWDISTPATLSDTPDATLNIGGQYPAIDVFGNYLIMAGEGVKVVDITNPLNPQR